jgi:hypothetical protein
MNGPRLTRTQEKPARLRLRPRREIFVVSFVMADLLFVAFANWRYRSTTPRAHPLLSLLLKRLRPYPIFSSSASLTASSWIQERLFVTTAVG